jgi:hypothetical protein
MVPTRSAVTSRQFAGNTSGLRGGVGAGLSVMRGLQHVVALANFSAIVTHQLQLV